MTSSPPWSGSFHERQRDGSFSNSIPGRYDGLEEVSYYTKVFETEEPRIIPYHGSFPSPHLSYTRMTSGVSSPHTTPSLRVNSRLSDELDTNKRVTISKKKLVILSMILFLLLVLAAGAIFLYLACLEDVDLYQIQIDGARLMNTTEHVRLELDLSIRAKNQNIQEVEIHYFNGDMTFENCTFAGSGISRLKVGNFDKYMSLYVKGSKRKAFQAVAEFELSSVSTASLVIQALKSGNFNVATTGYVRFYTMVVYDVESKVNLSGHVPHPLLPDISPG